MLSFSSADSPWKPFKSCCHCWIAAKLPPTVPSAPSPTRAAATAAASWGFSVPSSKPVRSCPVIWRKVSFICTRRNAGASAASMALLRLSNSPRSSPCSQHQSACWVDGLSTPTPVSAGKVRRPSICPSSALTRDSPKPTTADFPSTSCIKLSSATGNASTDSRAKNIWRA